MKLFICHYCGSERPNHNSWRNHERCCPSNPNKMSTHVGGMKGKKGRNQYSKANDLGLPKPTITEETRQKISRASVENNLKRSEEVNKKISESMKTAHKEGRAWNIGKSRWKNTPSYPETFFMKAIDNHFLDKNFTSEFPIGIYSADFCWPHLKRVVEIDGDQHQRFEEYKLRDERKDAFLTSQGYHILRIVWKEMYADPKGKIQEAYDFIHKNVPS